MKWDFRHHLLMQIEMLRGDISHKELSKRADRMLGPPPWLAREGTQSDE